MAIVVYLDSGCLLIEKMIRMKLFVDQTMRLNDNYEFEESFCLSMNEYLYGNFRFCGVLNVLK